MPYAQGPYAELSNLPSPAKTVIVGARRVDFASGAYELDADGNPVGMNPTAQRVLLAVAFSSGALPPIVTDQLREERRARIEAALADLIDEGAITNLVVTVDEAGPGATHEQIDFFNTSIAQKDSVTLA